MTLGEKIQNMIRAKGYKTNQAFLADLTALFERQAITRRTLTRLVHDKGQVRLKTLVQVSHVLGVTISGLKEGTDSEAFEEEQTPGRFTYNDKAVLHCLNRQLPFVPSKLNLRPGGRTTEEQDRADSKESVKWLYVLIGKIKVAVKGKFRTERHLVVKGGSFVFDGRDPHWFENASRSPAVAIIVHYPAKSNIFYTQ